VGFSASGIDTDNLQLLYLFDVGTTRPGTPELPLIKMRPAEANRTIENFFF
jgi:hypothetical protein